MTSPRGGYESLYLVDILTLLNQAAKVTLENAGDRVGPGKDANNIHDQLAKLRDDIKAAVDATITTLRADGTPPWQGPAAEKFRTVVREVSLFVEQVRTPLKDYRTELTTNGATALGQAQININQVYANYQSDPVNFARYDADARSVLSSLANEYRNVIKGLAPVPKSPRNARELLEKKPKTGTDDSSDPDGTKDTKDDGSTKDPSGDGQDDSGDGSGSEGGSGGGDPGDGSSGGGDPGGGSGGGGDPGGGSGGGGDPANGSGGGSGPGSGSGSSSGDGRVPPLPSGPLTDKNRALSPAPRVKNKAGVVGIDVDGDGEPDLGDDGKPLPGAKLVQQDGRTGVDVNGDGTPDIGVDGEILRGAPIVTGQDGTVGVDVNGDGLPDLGISGQILPDAQIVTADGVRGLDVNGDGVPDIGMDRKPLHSAHLVTVDGITGVDVNGDGKPDIGVNGEILKDAPLVSTAGGLTGVDVNGDGKPDIATLGGQSVPVQRGAAAIVMPELPITANTPTSTTTSLTSLGLGGHQVVYAADPADPPTMLTALGAALAATRPPTAAPPGSPAAGASVAAGGLSAYPVGISRPVETSRTGPRTGLFADEDAWSSPHEPQPGLGRPGNDEWEELSPWQPDSRQ